MDTPQKDYRYDSFREYCKSIDNIKIETFKRDTNIIGIIENVSIQFGQKYLDNIMSFSEKNNINWNKIKLLNDIGNPNNQPFIINEQTVMLSPTTLRYVQFTMDTLYHIKNVLKSTNINIVEIGGGYGFQCVLLFELAQIFNIHINKYTILDLSEVNNLQKYFVKKCASVVNNLVNITTTTINNYDIKDMDLVISNYALGEFTKDWQDYYIKNVISQISHGYICWNFSQQTRNIHEYFDTISHSKSEENPQTNCYPIKSYIIKY